MLLAVVDCGGFSAAADKLDVQVAKVSRAVNHIESKLGVSLLNRTTRRVEMTDEGREFIERVRSGLDVLTLAEEELLAKKTLPKGRLRVDAASPFILHQIVPLVAEFKALYPGIDLELTSNEGFVDLLAHRTDIAIRIGKLTDSTLHARRLGYSPLYIVASPDYLNKAGVPSEVEQLSQHHLIALSGAKVLNQWPLKGFVMHEPPHLISSNGETVRQLALAGNGIACLSGFMVKQDIAAGRLVSLFHEQRVMGSHREQVNAVFYKSTTLSRRVSAFLDFIDSRLSLD